MDRNRSLNNKEIVNGPVIYWMSRDQRVFDNWALIYAYQMAVERKHPFAVHFNFVPIFKNANWRHYDFMIKGLREVQKDLEEFDIPFIVTYGKHNEQISDLVEGLNAGLLVTDFSPLRNARKVRKELVDNLSIRVEEVDAHNVIPAWIVSDKQEYAARTIRPKIHKLLPEYLTNFPKLKKQKLSLKRKIKSVSLEEITKKLNYDESVEPIEWLQSGFREGMKVIDSFINQKLYGYDEKRNDPNEDYQSNLSPYLHFGQISAQKVALLVKESGAPQKDIDAFLEELIVRKELSDNYCFYNSNYNNPGGFPNWARDSLKKHQKDKREYIYSLDELENYRTHDDLWNAAQSEMVNKGKMHGYMRMYWAKKILEWTASFEIAQKYAIYLNDKYELDGRDPNGYTGIAWSIGGVHDRPWFEREVFGKVRYMNYNGAARKFDVNKYIKNNLYV